MLPSSKIEACFVNVKPLAPTLQLKLVHWEANPWPNKMGQKTEVWLGTFYETY